MPMGILLAIGVCTCGGLGAAARYIIDTAIKAKWKAPFPLSTFVINVLAGLIAGVVLGLYSASVVADAQRLLLVVGFCGGFSTFSTLSNEAMSLLSGHDYTTAALYIALSAVAPIAFALLGFVFVTGL